MDRPNLAALAAALALAGAAQAQTPAPDAASWQSLPDWTGVWQMIGNTVFDHATVSPPNGAAGLPGAREKVPYKPDWQAKYEANIALVAKDRSPDPVSFCGVPAGFPRALNVPDAYEFVVRPEESWILTENGPNLVRIYTDGRNHPAPKDMWPTYTGNSVGHWEGDTLVFDTIGLKGEGVIIDRTGIVHSDALHVVTRLRKIDDHTLEARMTLEDPVAFTGPWSVVKRFRKLPAGGRVYDYACAENQRNVVAADGKTLTLGSDGKPIDKDR